MLGMVKCFIQPDDLGATMRIVTNVKSLDNRLIAVEFADGLKGTFNVAPNKTLTETLRETKRQEWLQNSHGAIVEYAQFVERQGCFGDKLRCF